MRSDVGATFRGLHRPGNPFVLANAWDAGSARMLAGLGVEAIGTSSAAHAFTLGRPDAGTVTRDEALLHAETLVAATPLPVSGDFENGFGDSPDEVAETVRLSADVGLAGISIEDTMLPGSAPYPFDVAVERITAAVDAARSLPNDFVLLARADGVMHQRYDVAEGIRRLQAFDKVGADVLYVPLPPDMESVAEICRSVSKPVNVLAAGPFTAVPHSEFAAVGVARISLGAALARVAHRAIFDIGQAVVADGDFSGLSDGISGSTVDALLHDGAKPAEAK